MPRTAARPPTLMKICGASSRRSPTRTLRGPSKRAWPSISVTFGASRIHLATLAFDCATIASLRALTRAMSTRTGAVEHDAEVGGATRDMGGTRARDQRLGRDAADVDAGAADQLALDDRGLAAGIAQPDGQRRAGLPGADDDRIVAFGHEPPAATKSECNAESIRVAADQQVDLAVERRLDARRRIRRRRRALQPIDGAEQQRAGIGTVFCHDAIEA